MSSTPAAVSKVRLRFAKRGELRLISHHDLMRCLERAIRRSALPLAHSQGFNPRPKVVFAQALGLGVEGLREIVDLDLTEPLPAAEVLDRLRRTSPPGLDFLEAEALGPGRAARVSAALYRLDVPESRREEARGALAEFLAETSRTYVRHRPDRTVTFDLRPFVLDAALDPDGALRFRLAVTPEGSARPEELVDALGLRDLLESGAVLARVDVELHPTVPGIGPKDADPRPADQPD